MTLLDVITKAASINSEAQSKYPIILNSDDILLKLKPNPETLNPNSLARPATEWELTETDTHLIELGKKFHTKLKRKLKDTSYFNKDEFFGVLNRYLEKIGEKVGILIGVSSADNGYTQVLVEKIGFLMGRDVRCLVLEACLSLEIWDLVETLIVKGLVDYSSYADLVNSLVVKKRSDLLCLCIKHAPDLGFSELHSILKYFLCPSKEAHVNMGSVRREWESQAILAIEKVKNKNLSEKKLQMAKDAAVLLMLAHDGFSTSELCLHYLLASVNVDEVILSSSIGKLSGKEMMSLIRYLGKWLKKYEMFPQAIPCPKASSAIGLKACDWVPKLEDVAKCLGLVLDENFQSLILHSEFHEELKSIRELVGSLIFEAKFCCSIANVIENLKADGKGEQN